MREKWDAKNNHRELHEILGRDYGIKEPYWGTSVYHAMMNYQQANVEKRH